MSHGHHLDGLDDHLKFIRFDDYGIYLVIY